MSVSQDINYFMLPSLVALAAASLIMVKTGYLHPYTLDARARELLRKENDPTKDKAPLFNPELIQQFKAMTLFVFGWIPATAAILVNVLMAWTWLRQPKGEEVGEIFSLFGMSFGEVQCTLSMIACLIGANFCRYFALVLSSDEHGRVDKVPEVTNRILHVMGKSMALGAVLPLAIWPAAIHSNGNLSFFLFMAMAALALISWAAAHFVLVYPMHLGNGVQTRPSGLMPDTQQSPAVRQLSSYVAPEINPYNPNNDPPPMKKVANRKVPRKSFKDVFGNTEIKERLLQAAKAVIDQRKPGVEPRNGILLDGKPGNGKSMMAEAMAGELGLPFYTLTHSNVASQWVGKRTEQISAAFDQVIQNQPCVFFIDEVDSFLNARDSEANDTKEDGDVVNSMLTLLVDIREHSVVVMAATNHADRLDTAAIREGRFDFKVEITPPDEEARLGLLTHGLTQYVPKMRSSAETIKSFSQRCNGFSVKRILAITEELPSYIASEAKAGRIVEKLEFADFMAAQRRIQGRAGARPENVKPLSELVLPEVTRETLEMLAGRMLDPMRVERLGGTLPTGVLFYGPPGTGKTVACKALAQKVDIGFLIATGPDLARNPKALEKLYTKAEDIRPCIIFIDEADDLLRSREYSNYTEATNKLLTLMDGVNDRVKDVLWVAATNHYDQIDPALLRGGRFTEKVEFVRPDANQLHAHVNQWLEQRKIKLSFGLSAAAITEMLDDESIANTEAVLQSALNRAISQSKTDEIELSTTDIERAVKLVLAGKA
jgi:transitional endoplasmic reticulum ATPase